MSVELLWHGTLVHSHQSRQVPPIRAEYLDGSGPMRVDHCGLLPVAVMTSQYWLPYPPSLKPPGRVRFPPIWTGPTSYQEQTRSSLVQPSPHGTLSFRQSKWADISQGCQMTSNLQSRTSMGSEKLLSQGRFQNKRKNPPPPSLKVDYFFPCIFGRFRPFRSY